LHTSSTALLNDASKTISSLLDNTEAGFDEQHKKYKEDIMTRINDNHSAAATLMQSWLSTDYKNFPSLMLSSTFTELDVIIESSDLKAYAVYRDTSINRRGRNTARNEEKNSM